MLDRDATVRRRALKVYFRALPFKPLLFFLYLYVVRRGFLDGPAGYRYATMMAGYQNMIDNCVAERRAADRDEAAG